MWGMAENPSPPFFVTTYSKLPESLYRAAEPKPVAIPKAVLLNDALAANIGISTQWLHSDDALHALVGNQSLPEIPRIAMAYAGHQFGNFVPSLGDGRAVLLGEINGHDLHLKGSGRTAFSRGGDGRATLSAMLREYIISEAMGALGIPTTRSLAVIETGEAVPREKLERGAVLTRVAKSHVRVGTFQYLAARGEEAAMQALVDHELARNFPCAPEGPERFIWFLRQIIARQAALIAKWMCVGFIHGVMNTDNMQLAGETIDYGPCAFMDAFDPQKTFSSIDRGGRYAWDKQPVVALWNLTRLAEAMLPLFAFTTDAAIALAEAELSEFMPQFETAFENGMAAKLGFAKVEQSDADFITLTLQNMANAKIDFTSFFSTLNEAVEMNDDARIMRLFSDQDTATQWLQTWRKYLNSSSLALMKAANPIYIPRNHRVEEALAAANHDDLEPLHRLLNVLSKPYDKHEGDEELAVPPKPNEEVLQTFCGT
jgi:serine/tyrosine/threonine adenylyltransferase